ncbi:MAG: hypothetical protein QME25_09815, partial [Bacteroidota bacterium]|nr:hypothetical protein [Bacteroidota bacterium]
MKKLFLFLLLPFLSFGQNNPLHTGEFIINLINYGSSWNVTFTATAIDARWDKNYQLTSGYENASRTLISPFQTVARFDLIIDPNAGVHPVMAIGLYKISAIKNGVVQAYFYMDWRTSDYGACPDVYFKYDYSNKRF